jgi:hypothetical protein
MTGVSKSAIARVILQREKLRDDWTSRHGQLGTSQKRKREGKDPDFDEALNWWFSIVTGRSIRVSCSILKNKPE